jgi:hypothetical protein
MPSSIRVLLSDPIASKLKLDFIKRRSVQHPNHPEAPVIRMRVFTSGVFPGKLESEAPIKNS